MSAEFSLGVFKYSKTCVKGLRVEPGDESVCTYSMSNNHFKAGDGGIVKAWRKVKRFAFGERSGICNRLIATIVISADCPMSRIVDSSDSSHSPSSPRDQFAQLHGHATPKCDAHKMD